MPHVVELVLFICSTAIAFFAAGRMQTSLKQKGKLDRMEIAALIFSCLFAVFTLVVARTTWGDIGFILTFVLILASYLTGIRYKRIVRFLSTKNPPG